MERRFFISIMNAPIQEHYLPAWRHEFPMLGFPVFYGFLIIKKVPCPNPADF